MDKAQDKRYMAAAIRLGRWHLSQTGTNPSVATILVNDFGHGPVIVGTGITGVGGRPHAEAGALAQAGEMARGSTAYVTLEHCAHHGITPPSRLHTTTIAPPPSYHHHQAGWRYLESLLHTELSGKRSDGCTLPQE